MNSTAFAVRQWSLYNNSQRELTCRDIFFDLPVSETITSFDLNQQSKIDHNDNLR